MCISLHAAISRFVLHLIALAHVAFFFFSFFHKLKVCGNPASSKSIAIIFPHSICSLHISFNILVIFSSVQLLSHVRLFATPWAAAHQASLFITNSQSLLRLLVHRVSDTIQPSHLLLSPSPPAFNLSQNQGLFQ